MLAAWQAGLEAEEVRGRSGGEVGEGAGPGGCNIGE